MTKRYLLKGLCCPKCAKKIQTAVGGMAGIVRAKVDFRSKSMTITADECPPLAALAEVVARIEEDVAVEETL